MNKREVGKEKEQIAAEFLKENGYIILEMNYNTKHGEIDIIAKDAKYICFVEVKYRKSLRSGLPEEAVNLRKMKKICKASQYYLYSHKEYMNHQIRYDVIAIENDEIRFYDNAFPYCL